MGLRGLLHGQLYLTLHRHNNTKFPDTATRAVIGVLILKGVLTLLHNTLRLLLLSGHDMSRRSAEKNKGGGGLQNLPLAETCRSGLSLYYPVLSFRL
jgi:hypothetical protein